MTDRDAPIRAGSSWRPALRLAVLCAAAWFTAAHAGCASGPDFKREITFQSRDSTNGGKPFYVLVRSVGEGEFLSESYREVAKRLIPDTEDPSVKALRFVVPGREQKVTIEVPDGELFAVYGMFLSPGEPWRVLNGAPLQKKYVFEFDGGTVRLLTKDELPKATRRRQD